MAEGGRVLTLEESKRFILAGKSIFTISNGKGEHFTYKVSFKKATPQYPRDTYFIKILTGPDNSSNYTYMGILSPTSLRVILTKTSTFKEGHKSVKVLQWALDKVRKNVAFPEGYSIRNEGRCGRCGLRLSTPESIDTGFGPECADKVGVDWTERPSTTQPELPLPV